MTIAKPRRPDQNTGRRAKVAHEVETQPCTHHHGHHELTNGRGRTYCRYCRRPWAELDLILNGERRAVA